MEVLRARGTTKGHTCIVDIGADVVVALANKAALAVADVGPL